MGRRRTFITMLSGGGGLSDVTAPTVAITLSQYTFKIGETATATFTFSEEPTGFTVAGVTTPNGSLSSFTVTGDPLIYTATFTPTAGVSDATNVITVGTGWTDAAGNPPAGSTTSDNYEVDTTAPTCVITCAQTSPSATTPLNFTLTFSEVVTGFTIGDITAVDSAGNALTKANFAGSGTTYTCDIIPTGMSALTVDVSAGVCVDGAGNANAAATQFTFTSTAPFSDAFTRGDGAIGSIWTGATWTIASNAVLNIPTLSAELLANPGFEGTYTDESGGGGGTVNVAPDWDNNNCETDGTDTLNESATAHGGSKSQLITVNATAEGVKTTAAATGAAGWYQISAWANITSGVANILVSVINKNRNTTGSWINLLATGRIASANQIFEIRSLNASNFLVDDASSKLITLASLFATLPNVSVSSVTAQVLVTVNPSIPEAVQAGHVINLDSISSPANFVIAYLYGAGDQTVLAKLDKCVAGVYTNLISGAVTFGATKNLKVIKSVNDYSLWYGTPGSETQIGTTQTIASMNGTIHGLFSTYPTPKFDTYQLSATP